MFLALALALGSACASDADDGDETTPPDSVAAPTETLEAPARLRSSRGDALTPARIELRAYLEGPTALTELHLDFVNDAAHPLEGTLELELPDDAAVVRVSFELAGVSREGELVSRGADDVLDISRRAAPDVGREPTRRVAAPTRASFQTRVPRIPARARARVLVAYAQAFDDPAAPYVTPLRELDDAVPWSHEITVAGPGASPITLREDGIPPARIERADDASVALARDELLLTRVRVPEELDRGPAALDGLTIALDTSASQAAQLAASVARVVSLVEALASETGRDLPVQLIAFDQSAELVFEGPARALAGAAPRLLERDGLGATSLASLIAALADVSARPRLLLVTDARDTVGGPHLPALRALGLERVDVLWTAPGDARSPARSLVATGRERGLVLDASRPDAELAAALLRREPRRARVIVEGAEWVWPRELTGRPPGAHVLVYARRRPELALPKIPGFDGALTRRWPIDQAATVRVLRVDGEPSPPPQAVRVTHTRSPVLTTLWETRRVAAALDELTRARDDDDRGARREALIAEAVARRLPIAEADWVLLASDVLYERRAIARHSRAGVLRVAPEGVELVVRDGSPAPAPAPGEFGREDDGQLTGVVVDGRGDPLRRALVVIECACLEEPIEARTDDYGVYRVRRLPPGAYTIQAAWRRASASRVARLSGRARARVNFRLEQGDGTTRAGGRGSTRGATVSADPVSPGMGRRVDDELVRADAARPARPVGDVLDGSSPPLDAPTITLTRAPPGLKQELRDRLWSLRGCYAQGLALDHRGRGRVTFEATAGGEHVDWVSATGHGFYQMAILECMQSRILEWRFADAFTGEFDFTVRLAPGSAGDLHRRLRASPGRPPLPVAALDGDYERVTRRLLDRDDAGALADARRWWRAAPRDPLAALALGQAAEARGELELAGRAYGSLVELAPTRDMAVRTAAGYLERTGERGRALARALYLGALARDGRDAGGSPRTRRSLAHTRIRAGDLPGALEHLERALEATPPRGDARALHQTIAEELALVATAWAAAAPEDPRPRDALRRHALDARPAATTLVALTWESTGVDLDLHIWDDDDRYASFREPWLGPPQARGGSFLVSDDADGRGPELFIGHATPRLDLVVHAYAKPPDGVVYGGVSILRLDARARLTAEWRPFVITRPGGVLGLGHIAPNPSAGAHAGEAAPAPADPATR